MSVFLLLLLPALSFVGGLASLQIDPKTEPKKRWVLVVVLAVSLLGSIGASLNDYRDKSREQQKATDDHTQDQKRIDSLMSSVQILSGKSDSILITLKNWGVQPEIIGRLAQSRDADDARSQVLSKTQEVTARQPVSVLYFPKNVDGPRVVAALEQGGLSVQQQSQGEHNTIATNAVWVGDDIAQDQEKFVMAKFVVLTLIRAGVQIKAVRRFKDGAGTKANLIEVGADPDPAIQQRRPLTVADVDEMTNLPARD